MSSTSTDPSLANRKSIVWVYLSGAMAVTFIVMLFLPDSGTGSTTLSLYTAMLWCGLFGTALWRYFNKSGWVGFAIGSALGLAIQIVAQLT